MPFSFFLSILNDDGIMPRFNVTRNNQSVFAKGTRILSTGQIEASISICDYIQTP